MSHQRTDLYKFILLEIHAKTLLQADFWRFHIEWFNFLSLLLYFKVYPLCAFTSRWGTSFLPIIKLWIEFWSEFSFGRSPSGFWRSESQLENLRKESACCLGEFLKFPLLVKLYASEIDEKPALKKVTL